MLSRRNLLGLAAALSATGCYGKFALSKKVYDWNGSLGNKWVVELVFLVLGAVQVYTIAGIVDALVLNLIEFWTGANPLASVEHEDGTQTKFARLDAETVRVVRVIGGVDQPAFDIAFTSDTSAMLRAADGEVLSSIERVTGGGLALMTRAGLKVVSAEQVAQVERSSDRLAAVRAVVGPQMVASR